jgi:putative nucleotidyltransferase with HDIG domain
MLMETVADSQERKPNPMQRLALEFVRPDMVLARDVYDQDGTIMVSAGTKLTERLISRLLKREILSVFIANPRIDLPDISEFVQETTRNKARLMVEHAFSVIRRAGRFSMSDEEQQTVHKVVEAATQDPRAVIHMAQINRHSRDVLAHSVNVALLSTATALAMKMQSPAVLNELALSALLHDIGQLMIPQDLLDRRESLKPEEAAIYREHTNWGFTILQQASNLPLSVALVAQEHHEHADGTGYPRQLTTETLHPFSRIVSAVNAYENMCADMSDRKGCQSHIAYESIMAGAGTRFDMNVAKALLSRLPMYPLGTLVELTNGFIGIVLATSPALPHRPLLKILCNPDGSTLEMPFTLDLAELENQTLFVKEILSDEKAAQFIQSDNNCPY